MLQLLSRHDSRPTLRPRFSKAHFFGSLSIEISEMAISDKDFPSSKAFDVLEQTLQDEETRKDMIKSANLFCF
jgi:hypothetical protein